MFKVGDRVRRISGTHFGMRPGDTGRVTFVCGKHIKIQEFCGGSMHNSERFIRLATFKGNK